MELHNQTTAPLAIVAVIVRSVLSQLLTLYTTPVVYLYLDRMRTWLRGMRRDRAPEHKQIRAAAE
jgi:hypothetical protein